MCFTKPPRHEVGRFGILGFENKNLPVIGEGSHEAKIMFIGEAPGKNEAMTAKPFCGASGKILDQLLLFMLDLWNVNLLI